MTASECPAKWRLFGSESETGGGEWHLVDTVDGPNTEPVTYKYLNRTCDDPGYYTSYKFVFTEWAPASGYGSTAQSAGYVIRDIVLNPNGAAWHYGGLELGEALGGGDAAKERIRDR